MVHANSRRSSVVVHSTRAAPTPVAAPAPRLIAKAADRCELALAPAILLNMKATSPRMKTPPRTSNPSDGHGLRVWAWKARRRAGGSFASRGSCCSSRLRARKQHGEEDAMSGLAACRSVEGIRRLCAVRGRFCVAVVLSIQQALALVGSVSTAGILSAEPNSSSRGAWAKIMGSDSPTPIMRISRVVHTGWRKGCRHYWLSCQVSRSRESEQLRWAMALACVNDAGVRDPCVRAGTEWALWRCTHVATRRVTAYRPSACGGSEGERSSSLRLPRFVLASFLLH